jgi:hypothetical protein
MEGKYPVAAIARGLLSYGPGRREVLDDPMKP